MKKIALAALLLGVLILTGCSTLSTQEKQAFHSLESHGITVDKPAGYWEKPASVWGAGLLNLLPGCGNFYLATGNAADSEHAVLGVVNLITWPISILWGIPEAAIDANNINKRALINYYTYEIAGEQALAEKGLVMNKRGMIEKK